MTRSGGAHHAASVRVVAHDAVTTSATSAVATSVPFDRIAERYEATRGGLERGRRFAAAMAPFLAPSSTVLEICVGTGAIAKPLADAGHTVVGVDLSRPMLDIAATRLPGMLLHGDAAVLPLADRSVDAVVAVWAVHVVGDFDALVDEVRRVLRPGGVWLVVSSTPDVDSNDLTDIAHRYAAVLQRGWDRAHLLAPRLSGAGFDLVDDAVTDEHRFTESPVARATSIERREWSTLWDLEETTWAEVVQPVLDDLRALPEPDRPRDCVHRHHLSIYRSRI